MPVVNPGLRRRQGKSERLGDVVYGAPGGRPTGAPYVCSYEVADALAAEAGCSVEHAHRTLVALGRVAQRMLLRGQPVGIPHVGVLHLRRSLRRVDRSMMAAWNLARHGVVAQGGTGLTREWRTTVALRMPDPLHKLFSDNAIYTGDLATHVAALRARNSARRVGHARARGMSKPTKEHTVTDPNQAPQAPKPRLLVEDADAVVDVRPDGRQQVTKVPDRRAEAEKRGVDESQL